VVTEDDSTWILDLLFNVARGFDLACKESIWVVNLDFGGRGDLARDVVGARDLEEGAREESARLFARTGLRADVVLVQRFNQAMDGAPAPFFLCQQVFL
jgi:hypothetical protein